MKSTGFAVLGILAVAALSYTYFHVAFRNLSERPIFDESTVSHYL